MVALEPAQRYEKGYVYGFWILYLRGVAHLKNRQATTRSLTSRKSLTIVGLLRSRNNGF